MIYTHISIIYVQNTKLYANKDNMHRRNWYNINSKVHFIEDLSKMTIGSGQMLQPQQL